MNYHEANAFLDARVRWGMRPGLERIAALVEDLGHPQRSYPVVHVSGTNGKYSVAVLVSRILGTLGLTVGTYTSPHLESIRERIAVAGEAISEEDFASVLAYLVPYIEILEDRKADQLTYFETSTAMALEWFFDRAVHAAVLECGLGGEYDATNVADALVAVITNVSPDHVNAFGGDLEKAAWEKAGIAKEGSTVVTGVEQPDLVAIVRQRAEERGAKGVFVLGDEVRVLDRRLAVGGQVIDLQGIHGVYEGCYVALHGAHQARNATLAVAACEAFTEGPVARQELDEALAAVRVPGRVEVVIRRPLLILDGGHNPEAAAAVYATIRDSFSFGRLTCVLGMLEDKLIEEVVEVWAPVCDRFVVTAPAAERAASPDRLVGALNAAGVPRERIVVRAGVGEALDWTLDAAVEDDLVLVFGSFYTVGEARVWLREQGHLQQA